MGFLNYTQGDCTNTSSVKNSVLMSPYENKRMPIKYSVLKNKQQSKLKNSVHTFANDTNQSTSLVTTSINNMDEPESQRDLTLNKSRNMKMNETFATVIESNDLNDDSCNYIERGSSKMARSTDDLIVEGLIDKEDDDKPMKKKRRLRKYVKVPFAKLHLSREFFKR